MRSVSDWLSHAMRVLRCLAPDQADGPGPGFSVRCHKPLSMPLQWHSRWDNFYADERSVLMAKLAAPRLDVVTYAPSSMQFWHVAVQATWATMALWFGYTATCEAAT